MLATSTPWCCSTLLGMLLALVVATAATAPQMAAGEELHVQAGTAEAAVPPPAPPLQDADNKPTSFTESFWYHYSMLNDVDRNEKYRRAIEATIGRIRGSRDSSSSSGPVRVLDVGAGAGLLSLVSARAGAKVYAVEVNPTMADVARRTSAANGFGGGGAGDQITVLNKLSFDVELEERVDVIVHEIFGRDLLCENVGHAIPDARERLLRPGGAIVPARARQFIGLAQSEVIETTTFVYDALGFDMSEFNRERLKALHNVDHVSALAHLTRPNQLKPLGPAAQLFDVDFYTTGRGIVDNFNEIVNITVGAEGVLDALVVWWDADMDAGAAGAEGGGEILSTGPFAPGFTQARTYHWAYDQRHVQLEGGARLIVKVGDVVSVRVFFMNGCRVDAAPVALNGVPLPVRIPEGATSIKKAP